MSISPKGMQELREVLGGTSPARPEFTTNFTGVVTTSQREHVTVDRAGTVYMSADGTEIRLPAGEYCTARDPDGTMRLYKRTLQPDGRSQFVEYLT